MYHTDRTCCLFQDIGHGYLDTLGSVPPHMGSCSGPCLILAGSVLWPPTWYMVYILSMHWDPDEGPVPGAHGSHVQP